MNVITIKDVSQKYRLKFVRNRKTSWEETWVLENINLSIAQGEILGVVGENGSGKTTLLKLLAGMLVADKGDISVQGRVATLMELGAGFDREFTGRENILLNAKMYGFQKEALEKCAAQVIEFAGLGKFIDVPVKCYSQGMYMRLGFALAVFVDPDIFLVDDILSVGDEDAQRKCVRKIFELKNSGKTMIIVSHDMHLVRQLCDRVILFEKGRIVRQGRADEVIPYYLEQVGDKAGIAAIEDSDLRLIFNNGSLSLRYKGTLLTLPSGGYVSFFVPSLNHWCPSRIFSWQVKEQTAHRIVAEGIYGDGSLSQEWTLELKKGQIVWRVRTNGTIIKEPHIDLFLIPRYNQWRTIKEQKSFSHFVHKHDWQSLDTGGSPGGVLGLMPQDTQEKKYPYISLVQDADRAPMSLLNSGYEMEARVAQVFFTKDMFVSFCINIFEDEKEWKAYWVRVEENFYAQSCFKNRKLPQESMIEQGDLRLFVDEEKKRIHLFCRDEELTGPNGLSSIFDIHQRKFFSREAFWKVEKVAPGTLVLTLEFVELKMTQRWYFSFSGDNQLHIKCTLSLQEATPLIHQDVSLELKDIYQAWQTSHEKGVFEPSDHHALLTPIRWRNNKVPRVLFSCEGKKSDHASLLFSVISEPGSRVMNLHTRREGEQDFICLNSSLIIPAKTHVVNPGTYDYFQGDISLGDADVKILEDAACGQRAQIKQGDFCFVFDGGRGRFYWQGKELTQDLSLYTSLRSQGIWLDSFQGLWMIEEKTDKKIVVSGAWPYLPVSQRWVMTWDGDKGIHWEVQVQIHEEVKIDIEQAGLMVSSYYRHWQATNSSQGEFPEEYTQDYDVLPYRCWSGDSSELCVSSDRLPRIILKQDADDRCLKGLIENTDSVYRARLLLYQKANAKMLSIGTQRLFKGTIKIEP